MIDIRKLKELVRLMVANELTELDLRDSEEQVTLRRGGSSAVVAAPAVTAAPVVPAPTAGEAAAGAAPAPGGGDAAAEDDGLHVITSPMVGTFFAASSPDADAFVGVGSELGPDTTVCIVEAMKLFNEIKAGVSGTVQKVLVKNGEAVEFGKPLFLVKPS